MDEPPRYPDSADEPAGAPERESSTGTPRWVKVSAVVALIVVVLFVVLLIAGGHNPGRHTGAGGGGASLVSLPSSP
jgi:hypothetical protein